MELVLDCGKTIDYGEDWSLPPIWQDEARIRMYLFSSLTYNIIMYKTQP